MVLKSFFALLMLAVLVSIAWRYQAVWTPSPATTVLAREAALPEAVAAAMPPALSLPWAARTPGPPTPNTTVHKCLRDGQVLYTDERCPGGSNEQHLRHGTLTVLPSPARPAAATENAAPPTRLAQRPDALASTTE